jgi:hypothetical protein
MKYFNVRLKNKPVNFFHSIHNSMSPVLLANLQWAIYFCDFMLSTYEFSFKTTDNLKNKEKINKIKAILIVQRQPIEFKTLLIEECIKNNNIITLKQVK